MISGILTAILMVAFLLMVVWAWSDRRKDQFKHMSNLPLEEDSLNQNNTEGEENGND